MPETDVGESRTDQFLGWLPYLSAVAAGVWAFAGAFLDLLPLAWRLGIAICVFTLIAAGAIAHRRERLRWHEIAAKLEDVADLDAAIPARAISDIATLLFRRGSVWRVTIYVVEQSNDGEWELRHLARRSASQAHSLVGRSCIRLDFSILRGLWNVSLPHGEPTGEAPNPVGMPDAWAHWQFQFLQDDAAVQGLRMRSQRYAWCATREPDGGERTVALVAETLEPDGIYVENLESPLIFSSLLMIARWYELRDIVGSAARDGARAITAIRS